MEKFLITLPFLGKISLSPSDIIQIISICVSLITSIVAIVISLRTLRQNSKMIEDSSRPYITVYIGDTYFSSVTVYLILKNFGNSSAKITNFSASCDLKAIAYDADRVPFSNIVGTFLCPGESLRFPVDLANAPEDLRDINISIEYSSSGRTYQDATTLNLISCYDALHLRANTKDQHLKEISFALQDIAEKML